MATASRYTQIIELFVNPPITGTPEQYPPASGSKVSIPGVAVSGTTTFMSEVIDAQSMALTLNLEVWWTGGMTGTFQLLACNDLNEQTMLGEWVPVTGVSLPAPGSAVGTANGVTAATNHGSSTADGVTVAFTAPYSAGTTLAAENPFNNATITSATYGFTSNGVAVGDFIKVSAGADAGTYVITAINSATSVQVAVPQGTSFTGTAGNTIQVVSSLTGTLTDAGAGFIAAGVTPGMLVQIQSATDQGWYTVLNVNSATVLLLATNPVPTRSAGMGAYGRKPFTGGSSLTYAIPQSWMLNLANPGARFYRVIFNPTGSTGTLFGRALVKG